MLGLDHYDRESDYYDYIRVGTAATDMMKSTGAAKKKPIAITETGLENNDPKWNNYYNLYWWTTRLYTVIKNQSVSYALVWRNGDFPGKGHFFSAYRGCYTENDFITFVNKGDILLEDNLPDMYE